MDLEETFLLEEAADYLELRSFLRIIESFIDKNFQILSKTEAFKRISSDRLGLLLTRESLIKMCTFLALLERDYVIQCH